MVFKQKEEVCVFHRKYSKANEVASVQKSNIFFKIKYKKLFISDELAKF
jgi:hypothetical protein